MTWVELEYFVDFGNGPIKCMCYEGEYDEFVNEWGNKLYTHHPLGLYQKIVDWPEFRHLSKPRLWEIIKKFSRTRHYGGYGTLHSIEIEPKPTIKNIAIIGGVKCLCCDNMVWPGVDVKEDSYSSVPLDSEEEYGRIDYGVADIFPSSWYSVKSICESCNRIAQTQNTAPFVGRNTHYLNGLLAIYKNLARATFGKHWQRRGHHMTKSISMRVT